MTSNNLRDHVQHLLAAEYDIHEELGRGGMAVVYAATHRGSRKRFALKVLPPHFAFNEDIRERFVREARASAALDHPAIVPVYSAAVTGNIAWFVMALVQGESLGARLRRSGTLPTDEVRWILAEVADALDYAHRSGLVHRDVKPDNILLEEYTGRPLLTDFGVARETENDHRITRDGDAIGTPAYMSPEQAIGEEHIDARADVYSLGVVGYEMLAGSVPFVSTNAAQLILMHVSERAAPILDRRPDTPLILAEAIGRAMEKRADDRWPSMQDFRTALGAVPVPVRLAARISAAGPPPADGPAPSIIARVRTFREKAARYGLFGTLLAILYVLTAPLDKLDYPYFKYASDYTVMWFFGLRLTYLLMRDGTGLFADGVPVKALVYGFPDARRRDASSEPPMVQPASRYEAARRRAVQEQRRIEELLAPLSPEIRALIASVSPTALMLRAEVEALAKGLREIDGPLDARREVPEVIYQRMDSAVDALQTIRHKLAVLSDTGFVTGAGELNALALEARKLLD